MFINKHNSNIIDDNLIQLYLTAIDNKNKNEIEFLYNQNNKNNINNIENDIVYEMYNANELNSERLQFIIENCTVYLKISSQLIKKLLTDFNKELLDILFENYLKFFDINFILNLLKYYKSKIPVSNSELNTEINNDKYKISTTMNIWNISSTSSSYYLFDACENGNKAAVEFLLKHGLDINNAIRH